MNVHPRINVSSQDLIPKTFLPIARALVAIYVQVMNLTMGQKEDERWPQDLESKIKKLRSELQDLKEKCSEKDQMIEELDGDNRRLEKKKQGIGHSLAIELSKMPLFFEGEINKELIFKNSVLKAENKRLKAENKKPGGELTRLNR